MTWRRQRRDLLRAHDAELARVRTASQGAVERERAAWLATLASEREAWALERRELLEQLGRAFDRLALVTGRPTPSLRESSFERETYDPLLVEGDPFADVLQGVT